MTLFQKPRSRTLRYTRVVRASVGYSPAQLRDIASMLRAWYQARRARPVEVRLIIA